MLQQQVLEGLNRMPWFWRRIAIASVLLWGMGLITYIAIVGSDATRQDIAFNVTGLLIATIGSYLFGATWDHSNERKANLAAAAINPPTDVGSVTTDVNVKV